jgi:hypothetical protein
VRCPKEDQEHEQVLPASGPRSSANAIAGNTPGWAWQRIRTEASRLHAVTFTRPATHRPAKTHSGTSRNTLTSANTQQPPTALTGPPPGDRRHAPCWAITHSRRSDHVFVG